MFQNLVNFVIELRVKTMMIMLIVMKMICHHIGISMTAMMMTMIMTTTMTMTMPHLIIISMVRELIQINVVGVFGQ